MCTLYFYYKIVANTINQEDAAIFWGYFGNLELVGQPQLLLGLLLCVYCIFDQSVCDVKCIIIQMINDNAIYKIPQDHTSSINLRQILYKYLDQLL